MRTLVVAIAVMSCSAATGLAQGTKHPEVDKIRAAYEKAVTAGDIAGVVALYADDAVVMPPDMPLVKGKANIEAFHKKMHEMAAVSNLAIMPTESYVMGDLAYDVGTYKQTLTPKGGAAMNDSGKYFVLLEKQADGSWKLKYEIYNSDKALPMGQPSTKPSGQ